MMAGEPTYPEDVPVGDAADPPGGDGKAASKRTRQLVTGAAIGIGSAALVAALLYANRSRKAGGGGEG